MSEFPIDIDDVGPFDPPMEIPCPQCEGALTADGPNTKKTKIFVRCVGECGLTFQIPLSNLLPDYAHVRPKTETKIKRRSVIDRRRKDG